MQDKLNTYFTRYITKHSQETIYAIFDGVKYPMIWSDLEDGSLIYDSIFKEKELKVALEKVAPFLVQLDFKNDFSNEESLSLLNCYGNNGCIFIATDLSFLELLEKAQELFYIYNSNNEVGYFRFFRPTVFEELIEQTHGNALFNLFYEITGYWAESSYDTEEMYYYSIENKSPRKDKIRLKHEI